ncbi:MAG: site-2 protease family protein [Hyphomonadaceae bacterium]|nr:site-2 protease family protein [Clostridia bacterium]
MNRLFSQRGTAILILAVIGYMAFNNMSGGNGFSNVLDTIIYLIPAILLSLTVHEFCHGFAAYLMGDNTAKYQGRLSLNPIRHLDPMGTVMMVITGGFGWAKPVPFNMHNFRNRKLGLIFVALAGPISNFLFAFITMIIYFAFYKQIKSIAYLDGFLSLLISVNVSLGVFNLIPIPPLDGSKVLTAVLPPRQQFFVLQYEHYGIFLLLLLSFSGVFGRVIIPAREVILHGMSAFLKLFF